MDGCRQAAWTAAAWIGTGVLVLGQSTKRVSASPINTQGNYHDLWGAISADGRHVAFQSFSSNLSLTDTNFHLPDILVKDRTSGNTTMASVSSGSVQGDSGSVGPSTSGDGRWVAFESPARNLVAGDTNATWDVFVRDQVSGTTIRVSVGPGGLEANGAAQAPRLGYAELACGEALLEGGEVDAARLHLESAITVLAASASASDPALARARAALLRSRKGEQP
jgi:hypothetical protein